MVYDPPPPPVGVGGGLVGILRWSTIPPAPPPVVVGGGLRADSNIVAAQIYSHCLVHHVQQV